MVLAKRPFCGQHWAQALQKWGRQDIPARRRWVAIRPLVWVVSTRLLLPHSNSSQWQIPGSVRVLNTNLCLQNHPPVTVLCGPGAAPDGAALSEWSLEVQCFSTGKPLYSTLCINSKWKCLYFPWQADWTVCILCLRSNPARPIMGVALWGIARLICLIRFALLNNRLPGVARGGFRKGRSLTGCQSSQGFIFYLFFLRLL